VGQLGRLGLQVELQRVCSRVVMVLPRQSGGGDLCSEQLARRIAAELFDEVIVAGTL